MSYGGYDNGYRSRGFPAGRVLIALAIAGFTLVSYFTTRSENPITHKKQHVGMTAGQEIAMGLQAAPQMARQYGGESRDGAAQARVSRVGRRLISQTAAGASPYKFQFHLLADDQTINAFALPGGQIFITEGLYRKLSTDGELAGVLAHEIGHVIERHSAQQLAKSRLTQGLTGAAVIASYDPNNPNSRNTAAVAAAIGQLVNLRYGRQDELEADGWGVKLTAKAGYDPRAMIKVMHILEEASKGRAPPEFFSTHPNPEHRIDRIQAALDRQFPNGVPEGLQE